MKRFNCTLSDKRGEFGECMEVHNTGRYVLFSDVEKLQRRMQEMLDKSNRTGVAIERAISTGFVRADHPLKSRLELLANHYKREQALVDGMVTMADRCKLLIDLLREARNPLITAMEASSEDASAETCELLELIDSALAATLQAQPDADWTEATPHPTEQDYRELQGQHDKVQSRLKAVLDLLHELREGAEIHQHNCKVCKNEEGVNNWTGKLARIDAALAGNMQHPAVTVTETIHTAPERIWLQVGDQSHYHSEPFPSDTSEVSWCADSVVGCEVPYVRADLACQVPVHKEMQGWLPIETAPQDGSKALVYRPLAENSGDERIAVKRLTGGRSNSCWDKTVPPGETPCNPTDGACHVTHWMPLPDEPAQQGGEPCDSASPSSSPD
ncbi:hypothetical protein [Aeromonas caviae]|uniref:hypothetical protein n=1 Tax=Aeromonas caviae TaxID=648 RepID=UPI000DE58E70|nr:hypothetical protein [Aeromonas caviae]